MTNDRNDQVQNDPALSQSLTVRELIFQILSSGVDLDERVIIDTAPWSKYTQHVGSARVSVEDGLLVINSNGQQFYGFDEDEDEGEERWDFAQGTP